MVNTLYERWNEQEDRKLHESSYLSLNERSQFNRWMDEVSLIMGISDDPTDPLHFYDYEKAWKAGVPVPREGEHLPSDFKHDLHPTRYKQTPDGIWDTKYNIRATMEDVIMQGYARDDLLLDIFRGDDEGYAQYYDNLIAENKASKAAAFGTTPIPVEDRIAVQEEHGLPAVRGHAEGPGFYMRGETVPATEAQLKRYEEIKSEYPNAIVDEYGNVQDYGVPERFEIGLTVPEHMQRIGEQTSKLWDYLYDKWETAQIGQGLRPLYPIPEDAPLPGFKGQSVIDEDEDELPVGFMGGQNIYRK